MQGYIVKITPMKNEDLIVRILTESSLRDFYRFYGARHSVINLGYKIDFEEKPSAHFMPQVRSIMHLASAWERDFERIFAWQKFISLLAKHLQDVEEIDEFYFKILESASKKMSRQNPLRVLLEAYAQILKFEGRLRLDDICFACAQILDSQSAQICVARAFLPAHQQCISGSVFDKVRFFDFLQNANTAHLSDDEVQSLWQILCFGF